MLNYRLYLLNASGHILSAIDLQCEGDAAALAIAETEAERRDVELWEGVRKVRHIPCRAPRPAQASGLWRGLAGQT